MPACRVEAGAIEMPTGTKMPHLTHIPVGKARFVARLAAADIGHLIQMSEAAAGGDKTSSRPVIVMKAESRVQYGGLGVIHIEGPLVGVFIRTTRQSGLNPPVIDVNDLAEVSIHDAAPGGPINETPSVGSIGWATDHSGEGVFCIAVGLDLDEEIIGFAPLSGPRRGFIETMNWYSKVGVAVIAATGHWLTPAAAAREN
jgi:hypothetical protein